MVLFSTMSLVTSLKGTQWYRRAASSAYRHVALDSNNLFNKPIVIRCQTATVSTKRLIDRYRRSKVVSDAIPDLSEAQRLRQAPGVNSTATIPSVINTIDTSEDPRFTKNGKT
ncbi:hypothetical protein DSO57_1023686 [Entomophthora muscae]|uniref:Uncharacterized protein n=1 Tax=Entomophthora muscae TaxID=34485 RepID=A0ACC2T3A5_9FUNG|nr:hypothetical protein DSO57_1023686 [Entomophthora muscae]